MTPTLIVLGFPALGVGIVAFATRHSPSRSQQSSEQDTAWGEAPTADEEAADPFAHAPVVQAEIEPARETERQA